MGIDIVVRALNGMATSADEDYPNIVFVEFFKSPAFKKEIGVKSISQEYDRKSYDYEGLRERVLMYSKKNGKYIFLKIQYQPLCAIGVPTWGILNSSILDDEDSIKSILNRNLVRQVLITTGLTDGHLLYSYEPNYGAVDKMIGFFKSFVRDL